MSDKNQNNASGNEAMPSSSPQICYEYRRLKVRIEQELLLKCLPDDDPYDALLEGWDRYPVYGEVSIETLETGLNPDEREIETYQMEDSYAEWTE